MGTYTGTNSGEIIKPGDLSAGVTADPPGSTPGAADDTLIGLGGADFLDGGGGNDVLIGGNGDDTYMVRGSGDLVSEVDAETGGVDTVQASVSYTLGAGVENLSLKGSAPISGTGNGLDNVLTGNQGNNDLTGGAGDDRLDGGGGADTLTGGEGDDTYLVNTAGDLVVEAEGGGLDTVLASISYGLGVGVENLTLTGGATINGTGNDLANLLVGNEDANILKGAGGRDDLRGGGGDDVLKGGLDKDRLDGGLGQDKLVGGDGNDEFVFAKRGQSGDLIVDLQDEVGNNDRILVDGSSFKGGLEDGRLSNDQFQASEGHVAEDADVRFILDTRDDTLWFDRNGDRSGGLTLVADLQGNATMQANDIFVI